MRDHLSEFKKRGVQVLGVSPDSVESHKKFVAKHGLNFPLLADIDKEVVNLYKVWVEKSMFGKKYMGIERSTFLINEEGKLVKEWRKVKVKGHVEEVLSFL